MKKLIFLFIVGFLCIGQSNIAFAQAGQLDNTYGNGGKVTSMIANGGIGWSMCSVDGWSIVLGGLARNNMDSDFAVSRYKSNGTLDSTFGTNGTTITSIGSGADVIYSTAVQQDGKIIAGGLSWNGSKYNFALARYTTDGMLDNTFGTAGKVTTSINSYNNVGTSLCIQDGWSIVLGGYIYNGSDNDFGLIRYTTNGTIDSTFGTDGIVITDMAGGSNDILTGILVQPDSSIVVAGTSSNGTGNHFAVARYKENGTLDNSFGTSGKAVTPGTGDDQGSAVALQTDGKIVVGGYSTNGVHDNFGVIRYLANGSVDSTFGTNGQVITSIGDTDESIYSLAIQPDGKIIGAGSYIDSMLYRDALVRYNTDGSLDNTFGNLGKVTTVISTSNNEIYSVMLEHDGKILTGGYANNGVQDLFSMARYISGLSLGLIDFARDNNSVFIYPNPVASNTTIEYTLDKPEQVTILLLDASGRIVETLSDNQSQAAGDHKQALFLSDGLASGSYIVVISSPSGQMSIKIVK